MGSINLFYLTRQLTLKLFLEDLFFLHVPHLDHELTIAVPTLHLLRYYPQLNRAVLHFIVVVASAHEFVEI